MTDYISVEKQQQIVEEETARQKETLSFSLSTSVSTEGNYGKQQLHLYIYGSNQEEHVKNEANKLGMIKVRTGNFNWPHPRGEWVTAIVAMEDFSCQKKLETGKLCNTTYPSKLTYTLPSTTRSTEIIGNVEILDHDLEKQLVFLENVKFPHCPLETKKGEEHEEANLQP